MKSERRESAAKRAQEGKPETLMGYKVEQRQVAYRGRVFHFVSYEGQRENTSRGQPATPSMWFLMSAGTRWEVMPHVPGQEPSVLERSLVEWLKQTIT